MNILLNIVIVLLAFVSMEGVAWLTHKYVMHGFLWYFHRDHHKKEHKGFWERNDFFFLLFSVPGIMGIIFGVINGYNSFFWAGIGISLYGVAYFLVHDIFIHQRFRLFRNTDNIYLRGIRRAHKMHHKHTGKEDGECFGMLWVPLKYFRTNI